MNRLHMNPKVHSLYGLKGAQSTGKALLACMSGKMILQMTHISPNLITTDVTLFENTVTMELLHMSVAFVLVNKLLVTDGAGCRFSGWAGRRGNGLGRGGNRGRSFGNGLRRKLEFERRNPFTRGGGLRSLTGETASRFLHWDGI